MKIILIILFFCSLSFADTILVNPLLIKYINDGMGQDVDYSFSTCSLSANWSDAQDEQYGIKAYYYCVAMRGLDSIVLPPMWSVSFSTFASVEMELENTTYYFLVQAVNNNNEYGPISMSDGVYIEKKRIEIVVPAPVVEVQAQPCHVYPNPAKDYINVPENTKIFTISGSLIAIASGRYDCSSLPSGVYIALSNGQKSKIALIK